MITSVDQMTAMHKVNVESMQALAAKSMAGLEKLAELQMAAAKSTFEDASEQMKALFSVKDIKEFTDIANTAAQPAADKVNAYAQHVYAIATETGSEVAKIVEKHLAEGNHQLHSAIDAMAKTAPAGTEGMVAIVKQAAAAASSAFDQVNRAARQAVDMTEANIASVTKTAAPATTKARRAA